MTSILVIEDEELIRESIEDLLLAEGFEVITAENGEQGLDLAIQKQPHLIICDVMMPILNGYEVLEKIRQDKELSTVPFLFLTSLVDRRSSRKGMNMGADDYLEKPSTKEELLNAIAVCLEKQKAIEKRVTAKMESLRSSITLSLPHELQTPLAGIMGLSELMMMQKEEIDVSEVYEYAEAIHNSSKRLHRLIQNYLLYSKLLLLRSQGQQKFISDYPTDSQIVIRSICDRKAIECDRLDDLEIDLVDIELNISSEDLIKIIEELIDNAFKYSTTGTKVSLNSQIVNSQWMLTIEDRGRGMSKEQIADIGAYMQFDRQRYEQQGMGLGLVIARTLIEFYGGTIKVQSQEKLGTKMAIVIPI